MRRAEPTLKPGRVYRTRDLARWSRNPFRLARRLSMEGRLVRLTHGLYAAPETGKFGPVPPRDEAILAALLDHSPFVFTGPEKWSTLGLGVTAQFAVRLVYNRKRSGEFTIHGRRFILRRVAFPAKPDREWFVIDLFEHAAQAGVSRGALTRSLAAAIRQREFSPSRLRANAQSFGSRETRAHIDQAFALAAA